MTFERGALALLMTVLPMAFWPGSTAYETAKILVLTLVCGALLLNSARQTAQGQAIAGPPRPQLVGALTFLVLILGSGAFGANYALVLRSILFVAAWLLVLWLATDRTREISHLELILGAVTIGAAIPAIYGLAQIHDLAAGPIRQGVPTGISTFGNENQMSGLAALAIWPALSWTVLARHRTTRLVAITAGIILLTAIWQAEATGPRLATTGAALIVLPSLLLLRAGYRHLLPWLIPAVISLGAVAIALVFWQVLAPGTAPWTTPGLVSSWLAENNGNIRRTDWLVAWQLATSHGGLNGAGNYQVLWPATRAALTQLPAGAGLAEYIPVATRAHNEYLQALAELGAPGGLYLTAVAGGLLLGMRRWWHTVTNYRLAQAWLLLGGAVLATATLALVSFPLHLPAPGYALAVVVGLLAAPVFREANPEPARWRGPRAVALVFLLGGLLVIGLGIREFAGDLHAARGERAYLARRLPAALTELELADKQMIWPGLGDLYHGLTLMALGRDEESRSRLAASLRHRPTYEAMLALAELETAGREFATALARLDLVDGCRPAGNFREESLYLRAMVYVRQDDFTEAHRLLDRLLTGAPRNHRGLLAAGYLSVLEGNPHDARRFYGRALRTIDEDLRNNTDSGEEVRLKAVRETARRAVSSLGT